MPPSFVPDNQMLLQEIHQIQLKQGQEVGLQKIADHIKAEHPLWSFGIKRLREIRKDHNLAPFPRSSTSNATHHVKSSTTDLKLDLKIEVATRSGRQEFFFMEDIPAELCAQGAPHEITSVFLTEVIERREVELVRTHQWQCLYCDKRAETCFGVPSVTLTAIPPTVLNITQTLCSLQSKCAQEAFVKMQSLLKGPGSTHDATVYTVSY